MEKPKKTKIIFNPSEKARAKLDKLKAKGWEMTEVINDCLESINPSHYGRKPKD